MTKSIEEWVWFYFNHGFGVLPIKEKSKKPNVKWDQYQQKRADKDTVQKWLDDGLFKNIGVQCGTASNNLCIIDIDNKKVLTDLKLKTSSIIKDGCWVSSTSKGYHIWTLSIEEPGDTILDGDIHVDFKSTGYIVVPPSIHPSGKSYEFINKSFKSLKPMTSRKQYFEIQSGLRTLYEIDDISKDNIKPVENITAPCIVNLLDGVAEGTRDIAAFTLTQFYFKIKKIDEEATYAVMREWNKKNRPPLPLTDLYKCINQGINHKGKTGCSKLRMLKKCPFSDTSECYFLHPNTSKEAKINVSIDNPPTSRQELYERLRKWLYINNDNDTFKIDLIVASILSNNARNSKPLWIFLIGKSGDAKSELLMGFNHYPDVIVLDRITANTLTTGKTHKGKKVPDLGETLQNSSHLLLFSDLACLKSINKNDKDEIWGQLRELYDGRLNKRTGNGTIALYDNCHVTLIACSTPDIRDEYSIHNVLGTRELCYEIESDPKDDVPKMMMAITHRGFESEMKKDIAEALQGFTSTRKFDETIEPDDELRDWILNECKELAILRASGRWEKGTGELAGEVTCEIPARLVQQLYLLYASLIAIDENYPIKRYKEIVENMVRASGDVVRQLLLNIFKSNPSVYFSLKMLYEEVNVGKRTIKRQCELMTSLGILEREIRAEEVNSNTGLTSDIIYYRLHDKDFSQVRFSVK